MESTIVFSFIIPILFSFISPHLLFHQAYGIDSRQTLEISIGGSSPPYYADCPDCPPPADPPVCPEPLPPPPPPPPEPECPPPPSPPPPVPRHPPPPPPHHPPPPPPRHPPPPPPHHPPPPPPPNPEGPLPIELLRAVKVIETFRKTITDDPFNVTGTWNGRICYDRTKYKGFICDTTISDNKLRVAFVKFDGFRLNGKPLALTNFLTGLTDIIVFHANSNGFSGQVPAGIRNIPSLFEFDLSNNKIAGKFPPAVLTATNLTFLDLRFNQLTGELPPQVFTLDLDILYLNNNQFTGTLPETLGKTPALYVTLANNRFTGPIPKTLGEYKSQSSQTLREILLLNNQLSGCLPYQIGQLKSATVFDASTNKLTGPIPHSFGCLEKIQYLNISDNKLYGTVPEPLCKLGNVVELTLNLNYITQVGPECRKLIATKKMDVSMNCILDLPLQRSKEECEAFFLKQQSCPDPESFNRIPCKIDYSAAPVKSRRLMAQPRTYAALHKHT